MAAEGGELRPLGTERGGEEHGPGAGLVGQELGGEASAAGEERRVRHGGCLRGAAIGGRGNPACPARKVGSRCVFLPNSLVGMTQRPRVLNPWSKIVK